MIFGIKEKKYDLDPDNIFLAIATNIPQRLKTGFVVRGHIIYKYIIFILCMIFIFYQSFRPVLCPGSSF